MGLLSLAKKAGGAIKTAKAGYDAENKHRQEQQKKERAAYEEGRVKGAKTRGEKTGAAIAKTGHALGGYGSALSYSMNSAEKAFGMDSYGLGFGLGGEPAQKKQVPMRTTRISKSGIVTITEPIQRKKKPAAQGSPYNWLEDLDKNNPF